MPNITTNHAITYTNLFLPKSTLFLPQKAQECPLNFFSLKELFFLSPIKEKYYFSVENLLGGGILQQHLYKGDL